jgi:Zn-finger nucleic acid-binding protein
MMQRYFSQEKKAMVHECGKCGRVWLHGGDLALAIQEYAGKQQRLQQAQERSAAVQAYLETKQKQFEQLNPLQRLFPNLTGVNKEVDPRLERLKEELRRPRPN